MTTHTVGTREEWLAARKELPWVPVEKEYVFETADGRRQGPGVLS
jgi:predicted dithiol-disulfide oxidoreductase (DUF899 family)